MHSGLGLILNRNKSLFKGLLDKFSGASAAYSLRRLAKGEGEVVRVRRASDNAEQDFSSVDVANGTMANWVNAYTDLPLDVDSGASAAYSLRNLKASYTGDVVEVRRSSDDAVQSFTAAEVADGTLESWVGAGNDGHVKTWYDQSGNTNDAVQTDAASQPKIVEGGNYLGEIKFESGLYLEKTGLSLSGPFSTFSASNANSQHNGALLNFGTGFSQQYRSDRSLLLQYGDTNFSSVSVYTTGEQNVMSFIFDSTSLGYYNGTEIINDAATGATATQFRVGNSSNGLDGDVKEVIIYNSDQSDNRIAIEANIGDYYSIDLPAGVDSGNNEVDGFVTKWYDQSGNGNDAVQTTAAKQPKIVDAGTLVTGGIDFNGSQHFETIGSGVLTNIQDTFTTFVGTRRNSSTNLFAMASTFPDRLYIKPNVITVGDPSANPAIGLINDIQALGTVQGSAGNYTVFRDGAETGTASTDETGAGSFTLGSNDTYTSSVDGKLAEFIIYDSDQSANRSAIETNIADEYGITLS